MEMLCGFLLFIGLILIFLPAVYEEPIVVVGKVIDLDIGKQPDELVVLFRTIDNDVYRLKTEKHIFLNLKVGDSGEATLKKISRRLLGFVPEQMLESATSS